jgi:hypothetical protein
MRVGTYTDTLELENEMLRKKVKELTTQLQPYLHAEQKRLEFLRERDLIDAKILQMFPKFHTINK